MKSKIPENEFPEKITRILDSGIREIDGDTVTRLAAARKQALEGFRETPQWSVAWAGQMISRVTTAPMTGLRYVLPATALILGLIGIAYWQAGNGRGSELAELDTLLLTDELPIDAYLDKGFDSWLKRQSR